MDYNSTHAQDWIKRIQEIRSLVEEIENHRDYEINFKKDKMDGHRSE
jgi:predicted ATP-grasp superfamily ATP-dependent carboligase